MDAKVFLFWGFFLNCHMIILAGVQCYDCPKIARAQDCARTTICGDNEICVSQRFIGSNLQEYYKLGCADKDVCAQSAFSLFGASSGLFPFGRKRDVTPVHAQSRRQSSDDMVLCLQCCEGKLCNVNLCGSTSTTHLHRCFECQNVVKPHDCDRVVECGTSYYCSVSYGPSHVTFEYRYNMGCLPELQCKAIAAHSHEGCIKCCNDKDYCNFNLCDNYTAPSTSPLAPVNTSPVVITTKPPKPSTEAPPVVVITPASLIKKRYSQTVRANCISDPGVMIQWTFVNGNGGLPPGVSTDSSSGNLIITHLNETNAGMYICTGISKSGALATSLLTVQIQDTAAVVISVIKSPAGLLAPGEHFMLHCNVVGYPLPNITWSFTDKKNLVTIPNSVEYSNLDRDLTVKNYVSEHNDGKWTCTARNRFGKSDGYTSVP